MMINEVALEWRTDFLAKDSIFIGLSQGMEARMKGRVRFSYMTNPDQSGQETVDCAAEIVARDGILKLTAATLQA